MFLFANFAACGLLSGLACGMCSGKIASAKKNFSNFWDTYDFTDNCKEISKTNLEICKDAAPQVLKYIFDIATPRSVCQMITMCPFNQTGLKHKRSPSAKLDTLNQKTNKCQFGKDLADYLTGKGLTTYTIPVMKKSMSQIADEIPAAKPYISKANQTTITNFIMTIISKHTPEDIVKHTDLCEAKDL